MFGKGCLTASSVPLHRNKASELLLASAIALLSSIMLYQASTLRLSFAIYIAALAGFVACIFISSVYFDLKITLFTIFAFSLVRGVMFFFATDFLVLPFGDTYGQLAVSTSIYQSGHLAFIPNLTLNPVFGLSGYSTWPGLEILTTSFSRFSGMPLLYAAMALSIVIYIVLLLAGYGVIRAILWDVPGRFRSFVAFPLMVMTSFYFMDIPPEYKYDALATVFLFLLMLLVIRSSSDLSKSLAFPFSLLIGALTITHNLTALAWIVFLLPFLILGRTGNLLGLRHPSVRNLRALSLVLVTSAISVLAWALYGSPYGVNLFFYEGNTWQGLFSNLLTFSLGNISNVRAYLNVPPVLSTFTPNWLLSLLRIRDYLYLFLLASGYVLVLVRPKLIPNTKALFALAIAGPLVAYTILTPNTGVEGRFSPLFAPLIGVIILLPFLLAQRSWPNFARVGVIAVCALLLFASGLGFWANSYAPVYLYNPGSSAANFGEHPLTYPAVADFISSTPSLKCIFTNEVYVTSAILRIGQLQGLGLVGYEPAQAGCIVIVYRDVGSFNSSYVTEDSGFYHGFSDSSFASYLSLHSDAVLSTSGPTNMYILV